MDRNRKIECALKKVYHNISKTNNYFTVNNFCYMKVICYPNKKFDIYGMYYIV